MRDQLQISIYDLKIPFKNSFSHTSATRNVTQTIIVEITDGSVTGYGESCPREYVTGESIKSTFHFFDSIKDEVLACVNSFEDLNNYRLEHSKEISDNFAGWCAIELAFLDFLGRRDRKTLEELFAVDSAFKPTSYSAVIGAKSFEGFAQDVQKYDQFGFNDFKLKLSGNNEDDYKKLSYLKETVAGSTVRVDANNLWQNLEDVQDFVKNAPFQLTGIEEPLVSKSLEELVQLSQLIDCKIILDESFKSIEDLEIIQDNAGSFVVNLRISKQGGLLNSLDIARACLKKNIELIIGAQVGETAILTRASITLSRTINNEVRTMEGAFGTLFLMEDLTDRSLKFGRNGTLNLVDFINIEEKGNQLRINAQTIKKFSHES
jgi:L-alanine-DL-glutamate epimerase-like enolase superfamily enzyme